MKKHILVVDKDPLILYALTKALKDDGCEVETADTFEGAIEKLSARPYDLCLVDAQLEEFDGFGLRKVINGTSPGAKIIYLTTDTLISPVVSETKQEAMAPEDYYFIPKPFAICDITDIVGRVFNGEEENIISTDFFRMDEGEDSRRHPRTPGDGDICFQLSVIHEGICNRLSMKAEVIDISDSGIGMLTAYPLRENQVVGFDGKMNNRVGVVAWSRMVGEESFRVGIRFA